MDSGYRDLERRVMALETGRCASEWLLNAGQLVLRCMWEPGHEGKHHAATQDYITKSVITVTW